MGDLGEFGGGEVLGRPEQWGPSEQGPKGCRLYSPSARLTAAVLGLGPSVACPSAGSPSVDIWCPWPHSGSQWGSSDADPHNRHPGDRDSRPSLLGYLDSRSGYHGRSALPHTSRSPHPREGHGPGGRPGGSSLPPSHRIGPSRCRCTRLGSSADGPHSTQHEATGSRPSLHSGLGSRSVPRGSWCAGHSLYPCGEMGKPGGQASSPVHSPPCSPSDSARRPSTYSHGGSSAGGLSSRQPLGQDSSPTPRT